MFVQRLGIPIKTIFSTVGIFIGTLIAIGFLFFLCFGITAFFENNATVLMTGFLLFIGISVLSAICFGLYYLWKWFRWLFIDSFRKNQ